MRSDQVNIVIKAIDQSTAAIKKIDQRIDEMNRNTVRSTAKANRSLADQAIKWGAITLAVNRAFDATKRLVDLRRIEEASNRKLEGVLRNLGGAYDQQLSKANAVIAALERKTGVTDDKQREILGILLAQTRDYNLSLAALPTVLDNAAGSMQGLNEVARGHARFLTGAADTVESLGIKYKPLPSIIAEVARETEKANSGLEASSEAADVFGKSLNASFTASSISLGGTLTLLDSIGLSFGANGLGLSVDFVELWERLFSDETEENAKQIAVASEGINAELTGVAAHADTFTPIAAGIDTTSAAAVDAEKRLKVLQGAFEGAAENSADVWKRLGTQTANFWEEFAKTTTPILDGLAEHAEKVILRINEGAAAYNALPAGTTQQLIRNGARAVGAEGGLDRVLDAVNAGPSEFMKQAVTGPSSPFGVIRGGIEAFNALPPGTTLDVLKGLFTIDGATGPTVAPGTPIDPGNPFFSGTSVPSGAAQVDRTFAGSSTYGVFGGSAGLNPMSMGALGAMGGVQTFGGSGDFQGALEQRREMVRDAMGVLEEDMKGSAKIIGQVPEAYGAALSRLPEVITPPFAQSSKVGESFTNDIVGSVNWISEQLGGGAIMGGYSSSLGAISTGLKLGEAALGIDAVGNFADGLLDGALEFLGPIFGFATGVDSFKGGLAVVGENGPEVVELPYGSNVKTHMQSKEALRFASAGLMPGFAKGGAVADVGAGLSALGAFGVVAPGIGLAFSALNALGAFGDDEAWHEQFGSAGEMVDHAFSRRGVGVPKMAATTSGTEQRLYDRNRTSVVDFFDSVLDFDQGGTPMATGLARLHPGETVAPHHMLSTIVRREIQTAQVGQQGSNIYGNVTVIDGASAMQDRSDTQFAMTT